MRNRHLRLPPKSSRRLPLQLLLLPSSTYGMVVDFISLTILALCQCLLCSNTLGWMAISVDTRSNRQHSVVGDGTFGIIRRRQLQLPQRYYTRRRLLLRPKQQHYESSSLSSADGRNKQDGGCQEMEDGSIRLRIWPIQINMTHVSVEYANNNAWIRTLFSAMPRTRPGALSNVTLVLPPSQVVVMTGDSNAGKSTLLKVVATGLDSSSSSSSFGKTKGSLQLSCISTQAEDKDVEHNSLLDRMSPHPIYLDVAAHTPKYEQSSGGGGGGRGKDTTVSNLLVEKLLSPYKMTTTTTKTRTTANKSTATTTTATPITPACYRTLVHQLLPLFLTRTEMDACNTERWSQSQIYRIRLLEAAMESMIKGATTTTTTATTTATNATSGSCVQSFPAPLLLLDEWLDRETSAIIHNVQASLEALVQHTGGIVLVVTHKPERWKLTAMEVSVVSCTTPASAAASTTTTTAAAAAFSPNQYSQTPTTRRLILSRGRLVVSPETE